MRRIRLRRAAAPRRAVKAARAANPERRGSTPPGGKPQDDVVEADYEIVDDSKK